MAGLSNELPSLSRVTHRPPLATTFTTELQLFPITRNFTRENKCLMPLLLVALLLTNRLLSDLRLTQQPVTKLPHLLLLLPLHLLR